MYYFDRKLHLNFIFTNKSFLKFLETNSQQIQHLNNSFPIVML